MDELKTIFAIVVSLVLAIFAKRYSDMKKRDVENKRRAIEEIKANIIIDNDNTDLQSLVDRENERARRRGDS